MPYIYDYLNYRDFLQDFFKEQKKKGITQLTVLKKMGISSTGFLSNIIAGRNNLTQAQIHDLASIIKLSKHEAAYFEALVLFNQAKRIKEKNQYCDRLSALRKTKVTDIGKDQLTLFSRWYYVIIREMLNFLPYKGDAKELARLIDPAVKPQEVEKAIEVLEGIGLIKKGPDGAYTQIDTTISAAKEIKSLDIANFQLDTIEFAKRALERRSAGERDISTITLTLSPESFEKVRTEIVKFRARLATIADDEQNPDRVYQCNIQVFPMTKKKEE
jgi:uncharacterized protein (TIGR02147 family)